jgi:signal transduction histidine kinase
LIRRVVDNVLSNAIHHSPVGGRIEVEVRRVDEFVRVAVSDQGPGIPSEDLDRLFDSFEKLSAQPTGGEKSTGLGLSIVKSIVDAHGGEIDVDSEVGRGTTFIVRLPVEPSN